MRWTVAAQIDGAVAALAEEELVCGAEAKVDMLGGAYSGFLLKALL